MSSIQGAIIFGTCSVLNSMVSARWLALYVSLTSTDASYSISFMPLSWVRPRGRATAHASALSILVFQYVKTDDLTLGLITLLIPLPVSRVSCSVLRRNVLGRRSLAMVSISAGFFSLRQLRCLERKREWNYNIVSFYPRVWFISVARVVWARPRDDCFYPQGS